MQEIILNFNQNSYHSVKTPSEKSDQITIDHKNISTIDADGIMMLALQALQDENEELKDKSDQLVQGQLEILQKLEMLEKKVK